LLIRPLKQLEEENRRLKQMVADLSLDKHMLQGRALKKTLRPDHKRTLVLELIERYRVSERRACLAIRICRTSFRYHSTRDEQVGLPMRINEIARVRVRYGYKRIHVLLRREGWLVNTRKFTGSTVRKG
jgi:putative transposase